MVTVQIARHFQALPADGERIEALVRMVCRRFGVADATVSVGVVDDAEMSALNKKYLNHAGTTDCLSFDLSDGPRADETVFDLVVNGELAAREAARRGHAPEAELALYVAHGLLHQLGFDDATADQAEEMHRMEDEILGELGYGSVYNEDSRGP